MKSKDLQVGGDHYVNLDIQPAEFIHSNKLGYIEGSIIKYIVRFRQKNGKEDLLKARHFIDLLMELEYGPETERSTEENQGAGNPD